MSLFLAKTSNIFKFNPYQKIQLIYTRNRNKINYSEINLYLPNQPDSILGLGFSSNSLIFIILSRPVLSHPVPSHPTPAYTTLPVRIQEIPFDLYQYIFYFPKYSKYCFICGYSRGKWGGGGRVFHFKGIFFGIFWENKIVLLEADHQNIKATNTGSS